MRQYGSFSNLAEVGTMEYVPVPGRKTILDNFTSDPVKDFIASHPPTKIF
jgi:hypothetical protein